MDWILGLSQTFGRFCKREESSGPEIFSQLEKFRNGKSTCTELYAKFLLSYFNMYNSGCCQNTEISVFTQKLQVIGVKM